MTQTTFRSLGGFSPRAVLLWGVLAGAVLLWSISSTAQDAVSATPQVATPQVATPQVATETATYAMYCYWTGEATLGRLDGILASRIGHWAGREIVQVDYDPQQTNLDQLIAALEHQRSFDAVVLQKKGSEGVRQLDPRRVVWAAGTPDFIPPKHSLRTRHPDIYALDLNEQQAIALNSWSYFGGPMPDVLTAPQKARLAR